MTPFSLSADTILQPSDDVGATGQPSNAPLRISKWDHAYFRFPLNSVSGDASSATFRLYAAFSDTVSTSVRLANSDNWSEQSGVTSLKNYDWFSQAPIASVTHSQNGYIEFNVTAQVLQQLAGDLVISFEVYSDSGTWRSYDSKEGTFKPELVINSSGGTSNSPPSAHIVALPESGTAPLTVSFDASGSSDTDGYVYGYEWDFADGNNASSVNPTHTFETAGNYYVQLTVQDNEWVTDSTEILIQVSDDSGQTLPIAYFSSHPIFGTAPLQVAFDSSLPSSQNSSIAQWLWDF